MCSLRENEGTPKAPLVTSSAAEDEIYHLSENALFFDVILAKSHVSPASTLNLPVKAVSILPQEIVPVVLRHGGKSWTVYYSGNSLRPRFDGKWKKFVVDNDLKLGDACIFELIDPSPANPVLKVHILRGDLPPDLQALVDERGKTENSPIIID